MLHTFSEPPMTAPAHYDVLPYQVADDTFLITWGLGAPPVGHFPMHSLLTRGRKPVLVDTGAPACRGHAPSHRFPRTSPVPG